MRCVRLHILLCDRLIVIELFKRDLRFCNCKDVCNSIFQANFRIRCSQSKYMAFTNSKSSNVNNKHTRTADKATTKATTQTAIPAECKQCKWLIRNEVGSNWNMAIRTLSLTHSYSYFDCVVFFIQLLEFHLSYFFSLTRSLIHSAASILIYAFH